MDKKSNISLDLRSRGIADSLEGKLKALRQIKNWSQEDLAREIGVSLSTVQRWEKGNARPIRLARLELNKHFKKSYNTITADKGITI